MNFHLELESPNYEFYSMSYVYNLVSNSMILKKIFIMTSRDY